MSAANKTKSEAERFHSWENFLELHKSQFESMKLPKYLWKAVHKKLYQQEYIAKENAFDIKHIGEGTFDLVATAAQRKWGNLFIIPHIFVASKANFLKQLREDAALVDRLWKMMDLDALVIDESAPKESTEAKTPAQPTPAPRPAPKAQAADPDMVQMIVEQVGCSAERATQALEMSQNDLIEALNNCEAHPELREMEESVNQMLGGKYGNVELNNQQPAEEAPVVKSPLTEEEKKEQRIHTLYSALFSLNYASAYMVMEPRGPDSKFTGPPQAEEITLRYFVLDEYGSAIQFSQKPNVNISPFVCLTHNNAGYTLMWPEENLAVGDSLLRAPVAKPPMP